MFWQKYYNLCLSIGKKPNAVAAELGISSGSVTNWKKGTEPSYSTLLKIAEYFGCTVNFLLGKDEMPLPQLASIQEWKVIFDQMSVEDLVVVLAQLTECLREKQHGQAE